MAFGWSSKLKICNCQTVRRTWWWRATRKHHETENRKQQNKVTSRRSRSRRSLNIHHSLIPVRKISESEIIAVPVLWIRGKNGYEWAERNVAEEAAKRPLSRLLCCVLGQDESSLTSPFVGGSPAADASSHSASILKRLFEVARDETRSAEVLQAFVDGRCHLDATTSTKTSRAA